MARSVRSRHHGETDFGSPPLVTIQHTKTSGVSCDLNETIDENDAELRQAANEVDAVQTKVDGKTKSLTTSHKGGGKRKRKAAHMSSDAEDDKENNGSIQRSTAKRTRGAAIKPLAERPAIREASTSQGSNVNSTQESPPIFAFKQGKTALKARKLRKEKQQTQQGNQKRLDDLAAYFANLDAEKLDYL